MVTVRNKLDILQEVFEILIPTDEYENLVSAHMEAAAAKCIYIKPRAKCRVP